MNYCKLEQETSILYNNEEDTAEIFTYDKRLINKLNKRGVELIDKNNDGSYFCTVPKKWIKISPPKQVSDSQREAFRQRRLQGIIDKNV